VKSVISAIKTFLSSEISSIDNSILWSCLDDDVDDAILLKQLGNLEPHNNAEEGMLSSTSRAARILFLRRNVLRCLQNNIVKMKKSNYGVRPMPLCHSDSLSLRGISRIFGMTISLSTLLDIMNKVRRNAGQLLLLHFNPL
jgi:hypothetical protein